MGQWAAGHDFVSNSLPIRKEKIWRFILRLWMSHWKTQMLYTDASIWERGTHTHTHLKGTYCMYAYCLEDFRLPGAPLKSVPSLLLCNSVFVPASQGPHRKSPSLAHTHMPKGVWHFRVAQRNAANFDGPSVWALPRRLVGRPLNRRGLKGYFLSISLSFVSSFFLFFFFFMFNFLTSQSITRVSAW